MTQEKPKKDKFKLNRRDFLKAAGMAGAAAAITACQPTENVPAPVDDPVEEPVEVGQPLKGTTIKAFLNDFPYTHFIIENLAEFTEETGIEVDTEVVAWPVLLDQSEIELAAGSDNYDVMIQVFIKAQRWMRAGWSAPLDDFIAQTGFDLDDFLPATTAAMNWEGVQYGIPFLAESTQMLYRADKLDAAGVAIPNTFEELEAVLEAIHDPEEFYAWVMRTQPAGVHFPFPIWLQGYGGNIFADPPHDLTPTLNTPEAIAAATNFTDLILKYSIAGAQIYATPDCQTAMAQGLAGVWVDALGIFPPVTNPETSMVSDFVNIALPPGGPAGRFPQIASHGYQIPKNAKNKEAAWEFIRWANSAEMMKRGALWGYSAVPRKSVLNDPEYGEKYDVGDSKIGEIIIEALNLSKCEYRVVPEFPEVGNRVGLAIGEIISGQESVEQALDLLQSDVEEIMREAGHDV